LQLQPLRIQQPCLDMRNQVPRVRRLCEVVVNLLP
jgi:hypothetical protein